MTVLPVHADWPPPAVLLQPVGNAGAVTPSKFSVDSVACAPSGSVNETIPKFVAPSVSASVASTVPPHTPVAVKVNGCVTTLPFVLSTP